MPLEQIVKFIYWWGQDKPLNFIQHEVNVANQTAVDWAYTCRDICADYLFANPQQLGGLNAQGNPSIVEIDESCFMKRKYHRGQMRNHDWVFGMVERGTRRCLLVLVGGSA